MKFDTSPKCPVYRDLWRFCRLEQAYSVPGAAVLATTTEIFAEKIEVNLDEPEPDVCWMAHLRV